VCINCSKVRHIKLHSSRIKHKTTGSGPADSSQRGLTIKSCKLPETHAAAGPCTGRLAHSRAFVLVATYLLTRLAGFLAHTVTGMLAYLLIRPTRLPYPAHFGCGSPGWLLASFVPPEERNPGPPVAEISGNFSARRCVGITKRGGGCVALFRERSLERRSVR